MDARSQFNAFSFLWAGISMCVCFALWRKLFCGKPIINPTAMKLYILDDHPRLAAEAYRDADLGRAVQASAQLLCNIAAEYGEETKYKPNGNNQQLTEWGVLSQSNWDWLKRLAFAVHYEYVWRKEKEHKSFQVIRGYRDHVPANMQERGRTGFPRPYDDIAVRYALNPIEAWRINYVMSLDEIWTEDDWTRDRSKPDWWDRVCLKAYEIAERKELEHVVKLLNGEEPDGDDADETTETEDTETMESETADTNE